MKLQRPQIAKLARLICDALTREKLVKILKTDAAMTQTIENILLTDAQQETDIENTAKKMMEKFKKQIESGEIEYQKMYTMVKKQIMKEKKFIP